MLVYCERIMFEGDTFLSKARYHTRFVVLIIFRSLLAAKDSTELVFEPTSQLKLLMSIEYQRVQHLLPGKNG